VWYHVESNQIKGYQ